MKFSPKLHLFFMLQHFVGSLQLGDLKTSEAWLLQLQTAASCGREKWEGACNNKYTFVYMPWVTKLVITT